MDSRKSGHKRPFPADPISLITLLGVKKLNANAEMNFWMFGNNLAAGRYLHSPPLWGRGGEGGTTNSGVCGSPPSLTLPPTGRGARGVPAAGSPSHASLPAARQPPTRRQPHHEARSASARGEACRRG